MNKKGYTLIEIVVVIGIVVAVGTVVMISILATRDNARDTKRKSDLAQIGRLISISCFMPSGGPGAYDLVEVVNEMLVAKPEYKKNLSSIPFDPRNGSKTQTNYIYYIAPGGNKCAVVTNLENKDEENDLTINTPTPGGGTGVFESNLVGVNGTMKYYQVSN